MKSPDDVANQADVQLGSSQTADVDPWPHQQAAIARINRQEATLLDYYMGTGKTAIIAWCINGWSPGRVLILCPKSALPTWRRELSQRCTSDLRIVILDQRTGQEKSETLKAALDSADPVVVVVSYESAISKSLRPLLLRINWTEVVADESHRLKNPDSMTSRVVARLGRGARKRIAMSGTPCPNDPVDLFGQIRFLDNSRLGDDYRTFAPQWCVPERVPHRSRPVYRRLKRRLVPQLYDRISPLMLRAPASVLTLPQVTREQIDVELSPRAALVYQQLQADYEVEIEAGRITATNAAVKLLRLQQLTSGLAVTEEGQQTICTAKRDTLKDILCDTPPTDPVIVFGRFLGDLDNARAAAAALGRAYAEISGRSKCGLTNDGRLTPQPGVVCGVQIQSGGVGIDLTRARIAVYMSATFSLGDYEQSSARIHRPGQSRNVVYKHLIVPDSIDSLIYDCLQSKRDVVDAFLKGARK